MDTQQTITLTLGDQAENHKGMQVIGESLSRGLTITELKEIQDIFDDYDSELILLHEEAHHSEELPEAAILVIRKGVEFFCSADDLLEEQRGLEPDKKAFMYGRVVNKHARHNLCFADTAQEPDYENGKGTIIAFDSVPITKMLRDGCNLLLESILPVSLVMEGNYYYDITSCHISWHGDFERKIVIAARLGATFPLYYQWYLKGEKIGDRIDLSLNHSDLYIMSAKAVGTDWKKRLIPTLRHAATLNKKHLK